MITKAIQTKYISASNCRGTRIKATDGDSSIYMGYDHALDFQKNHIEAAKAFARHLNWQGAWYIGALRRSHRDIGYVFVSVDLGREAEGVTFMS